MNHAGRRNLVVVDEARSTFNVDRNAFLEADVMAAKHARVFDRPWLYLRHEPELAKNGDIVTFFNTCPHRGWTFANDGRLRGRPGKERFVTGRVLSVNGGSTRL